MRKLAERFLDYVWIPLVLFFIAFLVVPVWRNAELSYAGREQYFFLTKLWNNINWRPELRISVGMVLLWLAVGAYQLIRRSWWRAAVHFLFVAWFVWFLGYPTVEVKAQKSLKEYRQNFPKVALENLGKVSNRLEEYKKAKGVYPGNLEEVCDAALRPLCFNQSLWVGGPVGYELQAWGRGYKLRSAGLDAKLGTEDDIIW